MPLGTPTLFIPAKRKLLLKLLDLSADALKVSLHTNTLQLNPGYLGTSGEARYSDVSASEVAAGGGYATGGATLTGVSVAYAAIAAGIAAPGSGGTNGAALVTATTGTGRKATANVTITGGAITSVNSIADNGAYSALPTNPSAEPITGAGTGAQLNLTMGAVLLAAATTFSNATITAKWALIRDTSTPNVDLLAYMDLDTTSSTASANSTNATFAVNWNASGIFYLG